MPHEIEPEDLAGVIDERLSPERGAAVSAHLAGCADCRRDLESLRQASARFKAHGLAKAPAELRAKLLQAARRPAEKRSTALQYVLVLGGALLVLLLVGRAFKPQVSNVFNQIMGMVSGAAQGVSAPR